MKYTGLTKALFSLAVFFSVSALLFSPGCGETETIEQEPALLPVPGLEKPNVILITADDLGWKDLSCCGRPGITTPHIDRLAAEGVMFQNAFVAASSCSSSRASIMTGQYPHTNGVTGLTHRYLDMTLPPESRTMASLLRDAGYSTAVMGKWHVAPFFPTTWYGYDTRLSGLLPLDQRINDVGRAVDFIEENRERPFFLEINFMQNHRDEQGRFNFDPDFPVDPGNVHVPGYWALPDGEEIREEVAKYYSQTLKMDHLIGEILNTLEALGLADNTLLIFVSDNGAPFPGNKMTLYDRGTGTPLLVCWPGRIRAGTQVSGMVMTIDLLPTVLESIGLPVPEDVEGRSLLSLLRNPAALSPHEAVFSEMTYHVHYLPTRAARTREWKYIRNYSDIAVGLDETDQYPWAHRLCELPNQPWKKPRVHEELYRIDSDPREQANLAGDPEHLSVLNEMRAILDLHMEETGDPYLGAPFTHDFKPLQ